MHFMIGFAILVVLLSVFPRVTVWLLFLMFIAFLALVGGVHH